jgi:hypothetical protein
MQNVDVANIVANIRQVGIYRPVTNATTAVWRIITVIMTT